VGARDGAACDPELLAQVALDLGGRRRAAGEAGMVVDCFEVLVEVEEA
jgi:hypothetical protein